MLPDESVAVSENEKLPNVVGVPCMTLPASVSPGGSEPLVSDQVTVPEAGVAERYAV